MDSHAQLSTRSSSAGPRSLPSPVKYYLGGNNAVVKHFPVSAAILHRVKVKVLWKQAEGKITDKYFHSSVLFKVIRK